jgi:hypothetical protein
MIKTKATKKGTKNANLAVAVVGCSRKSKEKNVSNVSSVVQQQSQQQQLLLSSSSYHHLPIGDQLLSELNEQSGDDIIPGKLIDSKFPIATKKVTTPEGNALLH